MKILAVKDDQCICFNCLKHFKKDNIHVIKILPLGYESHFDEKGTEIHLCQECYEKSNPEIWKLEEETVEGLYSSDKRYKFEKEICDFLSALPPAGQELVWNEYSYGAFADMKMPAQDWIDFSINILNHDKCKEYGLYSPDEIKEYNNKYPRCKYPVNVLYPEGFTVSKCAFGAHGKANQAVNSQCSSECYKCKWFENRTSDIKQIPAEDFQDYKMLTLCELRKSELTEKSKNW